MEKYLLQTQIHGRLAEGFGNIVDQLGYRLVGGSSPLIGSDRLPVVFSEGDEILHVGDD